MFWDVRQRQLGQYFGRDESGASGNSLLRLAPGLVGVSAVVVGGHERSCSYGSVRVPGPHSHPAAAEKGGKDVNSPSGIRSHSEE